MRSYLPSSTLKRGKPARTGTYKVIISLGKRGIIVYNCRRRKEGEKAF
jgi:hypothetical protein